MIKEPKPLIIPQIRIDAYWDDLGNLCVPFAQVAEALNWSDEHTRRILDIKVNPVDFEYNEERITYLLSEIREHLLSMMRHEPDTHKAATADTVEDVNNHIVD